MTHPAQALPVFTVTIAGPERHDGEKPYTYVVHAPDMPDAQRIVTDLMVEDTEADIDIDGEECEPDVEIVEGKYDTFEGTPPWPEDLPGRAYTDYRNEPRALDLAIARDGSTRNGFEDSNEERQG